MSKTRGILGNGLQAKDRNFIVESRGERIAKFFSVPKNAVITLLIAAVMCYITTYLAPFIFLSAFFFHKWCLKQLEKAPLKIPMQDKLIDSNELNPGNGKPMKGKGIFYLGLERTGTAKEIWLTNDDTRQHFLILGTTGAGKAIRSSTLVHTENGWKVAGSIEVGELITTPFGENARVTGVFPQGKRKIWRITFGDGRTSEIDGEHLWEIHNKLNRNPRILTTKELYDIIKESNETLGIVVSDPPEKPTQDFQIDPYIMGKTLSTTGNRIPEEYLEGNIKQRWELLQGIMDIHGECNENGSICYKSRSFKLIKDIQKLAWGLGGIAWIISKEDEYSVHMKLKRPNMAFSISDKQKFLQDQNDLMLDIVSVEITDIEDDCVCFMVDHPRHLFVIEDYISTHNTELLLAFSANAISWGSGLIFVDGKGDIKLMATMYTLAKRWNREADFLVLNFMPPDGGIAPGEVISNTHNPYTFGEADDIIQQINGLMPEGGSDGMWKDRAVTMMTAVVMILVWQRNRGDVDLSVNLLKKYIQFKNLVTLLDVKDLPSDLKGNLLDYLSSLGSYEQEKGAKQGEDVLKQHGFLEMQFSGPFSSLSNTYGHVFNTSHGEVDMFDVVLNRRILVTMLPSLSKSPADVERMGKIIVASLKNMMGATLGNIGGSIGAKWLETVELRVTTSPSPCLVILDEVGYYTVNGMAMMAAQVRSLGFSMIYASQDLKAMTRLNPEEAQSIMANTNTKIVMRTEDGDTMDMAQKSAGKGYKITNRSYEHKQGDFGYEWKETDHQQMELEDRINTLDLKAQNSGEFALMHKDILIYGRSFYVDSPSQYSDINAIETPINQFIAIERPDLTVVENNNMVPDIVDFLSLDSTVNIMRETADAIRTDDEGSEIAIASGFLDRIERARGKTKRNEIHETVSAITEIARQTSEDPNKFASNVATKRKRTDPIDMDTTDIEEVVSTTRVINKNQSIQVDNNPEKPAVEVDDMIHDDVTFDALQKLNYAPPKETTKETIKEKAETVSEEISKVTGDGNENDAYIEAQTAIDSSQAIKDIVNNTKQVDKNDFDLDDYDIPDDMPGDDLVGYDENDIKIAEIPDYKKEEKATNPVIIGDNAKKDDTGDKSDDSSDSGDSVFDISSFMDVIMEKSEEN